MTLNDACLYAAGGVAAACAAKWLAGLIGRLEAMKVRLARAEEQIAKAEARAAAAEQAMRAERAAAIADLLALRTIVRGLDRQVERTTARLGGAPPESGGG